MRKIISALLLLIALACSKTKEKSYVIAHSHNDYEHERPLFEALENGFVSVEVDVHFINGELFVSHDTPMDFENTPRIEKLYLEPLNKWIQMHSGKVYKDYDGFFYLMVDIKTAAETSYPALEKTLKKYSSIISIAKEGKDEIMKPVKVFISGHHGRPVKQILKQEINFAGLDGREKELEKGISKALMPIVSENYNKYLSWDGVTGTPDANESKNLKKFIDKAHEEDKMVRLWAAPDNPKSWDYLRGMGVNLINTDSLVKFKEYYRK